MSWLKKLKEYAPEIATAILSGGTSLAPLAIKAIAEATGKPVADQKELKSLVENADPETMLLITGANNSFKIRMRELANDLTYAELADTQNARKHHKHSHMPSIIVLLLTAMVCWGGYGLFNSVVPDENTTLTNLLLGALLAKWGDSIAYWVGTTRSSANKNPL
jgi:hypothetical protein|tara:strand:- start:118 stop:609 length:492 start_codon:yes stop_codon:yes gene_type:complete